MTTLYFVRHGQSTGNETNTFTGQYQSQLTNKGNEQARRCAKALVNTHIDAVYASDLDRAYNTGRAIAERLGIPIIADRGLRELNAGYWENMRFEDIMTKYPDEYNLWHNDIGNAYCPGGETVAELQARIRRTVEHIAENNDGKTILFATHATPIRTMKCIWLGVNLDKMKDVPWAGNASITEVLYSDGKYELIRDDDCTHLADIHTEIDRRI